MEGNNIDDEIEWRIESALNGITRANLEEYRIFVVSQNPFKSYWDLREFQCALAKQRSELEKLNLAGLPAYEYCMKSHELLEEKAYKLNPEGGLN